MRQKNMRFESTVCKTIWQDCCFFLKACEKMPESKLTSAKVRLTVFVSTLTIGGAEQLLLDFLAEINQDKFDLFVCFLKDPGILGHELIRSARHTDLLLLINHRDALFYGVPAARIAGINAIVNWINETHKKYSSHRLTMLGR